MKKNYIHTTCTLVLLGMMVAGLWSCQKDDLAEQAAAPQGALQLTVIDNGYTAGQTLSYEGGTLRELPQTRATENGYQTTFTKDDQIGLYAVKSGALVATATNVCLTLTNVSGTLQWQPDADVKLPTDANYYFAYYPYKSSPGTMSPSATNANDFFANMITAWNPAANQSTATNYTAQDLMVGNGALGTTPVGGFYPLNITLAHKMGLAVIKLPDGVTDVNFNTNIPYTGVSGEYRYLLKPSTPTNLSCSFNDGGEVRGFVVAPTIAGGNYKTYTVSGKPPVPMSFGIDLTSFSSDMTYILPFKTSGTTGNYTLTVNWGDNSTTTIAPGISLSTPISHSYADAKEYTITISSSQTDFSKEQIPDFKPGYNNKSTNDNAEKLKSLLTPILNIGTDNLSDCFNSCSNLTSIPQGLFDNNPQVTNFSYCFAYCSNLTGSIPEKLFANNPQVTTFSYCFSNCANLTGSIPQGLFDNNPEVENFANCFASCTDLTGSIPQGLFANNPNVINFSNCFFRCANLTGSIPEKLFANNLSVKTFANCFSGCINLTDPIPEKLFANNLLVTNFSSCFSNCANLTGSIPEKLFANNISVTDFSSCFSNCKKMTMNANIFCDEATKKTTRFNISKTVNFNTCFQGVGSDTSVSGSAGTAPALWEYKGAFTKTNCFNGIGTVTNASSIDNAWK